MISTNISDFRANVKNYVDSVINNAGTVIINRGKQAAVLISLDEYNSIKITESMMSSEVLSAELETGIEELKSGRVITVNPDEL